MIQGELASGLAYNFRFCFALGFVLAAATFTLGQEKKTSENLPLPAAAPSLGDKPYPINLPTALQLANARALDIAAASERIRIAAAVLEEARVLWLPTITFGGDYNRHDGSIQEISGQITNNSHGGIMFGAGTGIGQAAYLSTNEAIFAPLVARQQLRARNAELQGAENDTLVSVTDAYYAVQQARGELGGAAEATRRTREIVERTRKLVPSGLIPELESDRAEAELARREQTELFAQEHWRVAAAELSRILRLDPAARIEPIEPPHLRVAIVDLAHPPEDLVPIALTNRPELAARQAEVQATLARLKQERLRPLMPTVLLRGSSTPVTGTLAGGIYAGGPNGTLADAGGRLDVDLQLLWQLDNLGFGNRARIHQRQAESQLAALEVCRIQERVAAEVVQAYAQLEMAGRRVAVAEKGVRSALASADKNLSALSQTKDVGGIKQLLIRPQEAVAAVQALAQAYADYYSAVADSNRAQFHLYRALGHPAVWVLEGDKKFGSEPPATVGETPERTSLPPGKAD